MIPNLQPAKGIALQYLTKFAQSDNFWQDFELAFGSKYSQDTAIGIQNQLKTSTFTIPTIVIVDAQTLGTANGAFAAANNTIYLSNSFVASNSQETIAATLIEEIGHSIDAQINTKDSAGDEGQLFSALVRGEKLTASQLAGLKAEDDRAVIKIGGKSLEVEKQDFTGTTANDTLLGTTGNDTFIGKEGNDTLTGNGGTNTFVYGGVGIPLLTSLGVDTITDFVTGTDKIRLHKSTFNLISSPAGGSLASNFTTVSDDSLAESQTATIIYSQSSGNLFYNTNGTTVGYGTNGGQFATLSTKPALAVNDFLIIDDKVNLTVSTPSVLENGGTALVYTFTRTEITATPLTVSFNVSGTAALTTDYTVAGAASFTPTTGTVTFAPNDTTATVTITTIADTVVEANEVLALTLTPGTGYAVGTATAVSTTIVNDDTSVSLAVTPATVTEDGTINLLYTFTRAGVTANPLTVTYTVGGNATLGTDYTANGATSFTATTGSVTFAANSTTAIVSIDPTLDAIVELDKNVVLTLSPTTAYTVLTPTAVTGTIVNDDTDVSLTVSSSAVNENGIPDLVYTFTRTGVTTNALTVNYGVGGTATLGTDYVATGTTTFSATGGNVAFLAGETTKTITINPTNDFIVEGNETVNLTLLNGTGYKSITPAAVVGTITNDDTSVTLAVSSVPVTENGTEKLKYTFTRTGITTNALTVDYGISGSALPADYTQSGGTFSGATGTVSFAIGEITKIIEVTPTPDIAVEANETLILTLANGTNYTAGTTTPVIGTIVNDDTDVTLALNTATLSEDGVPTFEYTFTRTGVTNSALTVNYGISGTAVGTDYTQTGGTFNGATGTVTFGIGATTAKVTINPTNDTTFEADETFALTLATGSGYTPVTTGAVTATILNDDTKVSLALAPTSVTEDGAPVLTYTFTRTGITTGPLTVNYSIGGTALSGTDYAQSGAATFSGTAGSISFLAGETTRTLTIDPTVDAIVELDETVALTLTAGSGYVIETLGAVTGTITNEDINVTLALAPTPVTEDGNANLVYTFTRTGLLTNALAVNYTIAGGADAADYAAPATVNFLAGAATATLTINPTTDLVVEGNETVAVTLATGTGYTVGTTTAVTGTIVNDDTLISLAVTPATVTEDGITNSVYTFTRTGVTTNALTVSYNVGGTAISGTDYVQSGAATFTGTAGTIIFGAGSTTATVTINPTLDIAFELDETVALTLTAPAGSGYNIGTATPVVTTITNDDTAPTISIADAIIVEGIGGAPTQALITVTLSKSSYQAIDVNYATTDGTAIAGIDYTAATGLLSFAAGEVSKTISVPILNDNLNEASEAFTITLSGQTNATIFDNQATIAITDTFTSIATSTLAPLVENLTLTGVAAIDGTGNAGANVFVGNTANNILAGLGGNDTYSYDADFIQGTDTINEASAGGVDTLDFSQTALAVNVNLGLGTIQTVNSNLKLVMPVLELDNSIGGSGNDRLTGNALGNKLEGGAGDDRIFGAAGDDSIFGGAGNDLLGGGAGIDTFNFNGLLSGFTTVTALSGVDTISDFTTTQDKIALSKATFSTISSLVGAPMGTNFIAVDDDTLVANQTAVVVYSMSSGSLFYNQNGAVAGLGTNGGEFATLLGAPTLASTDFTVVA